MVFRHLVANFNIHKSHPVHFVFALALTISDILMFQIFYLQKYVMVTEYNWYRANIIYNLHNEPKVNLLLKSHD